jgi:diaminopimelate decarboxylase
MTIDTILKKNTIPFTLRELEQYAIQYDTPYYIYDENLIKLNAIKYMDTFEKYFKNFKQFFAVKACPNPSILKILSECGMGFDCSSPEEIKISKLISPYSKIMYSSNYTSKPDLDFAYQNNCIINLDSIDGLENLTQIPEIISFRFNPDIETNVDVKSNEFSGSNTKFGMTKKYIIEAYLTARNLDKIKKFGLHTMCASNQLDIKYWDKIIDSVFELIKILQDYNIIIEFVNIGGGLGIPYKPSDKEINLDEFCMNLRQQFDLNIKKYNITLEPTLYTECGRYITGPYGYLVSRCQSIKNNDQIFYGLDANMSNLMRPGMYNSYHHISIPRLNEENKTIKANVVGTLCENNDWFAKQRELPINIKKGDIFVIHDCGAHAFSMGFNYNSKLRSCELLKNSDKIELIRERETFKTLFQNTKLYKQNDNINNLEYFILFLTFISFIILTLKFEPNYNQHLLEAGHLI